MLTNSRKQYLSLILFQAHAELTAEAECTYAGYLWWVAEPIISMAIYYLVFGVMIDRGTTEDFVSFLFVGLVTWRWISQTIQKGSTAIVDGRGLMQQVHIPKLLLPTVTILTNSFKFLITFAVLMVYLRFAGYPVAISWLALIPTLAVSLLLICALTYLLASVVPFFPDLRILLENALRLTFFVSGIFFAITSLSQDTQNLIRLNPFASIIESYRDILLYGSWPRWPYLLLAALFSLIPLVIGITLIQRNDRNYPKIA